MGIGKWMVLITGGSFAWVGVACGSNSREGGSPSNAGTAGSSSGEAGRGGGTAGRGSGGSAGSSGTSAGASAAGTSNDAGRAGASAGEGGNGSGGESSGAAGASAGDGGDAGDGGNASDAGEGGSTVVVLDPDVAAHAGAVIGSCHPDNGVNRETSRLWQRRTLSASSINLGLQAECIASRGGGCDALEQCLGWTFESTPGCAQGVACVGSTFTLCTASIGATYTIDCSTMGLDCNPDLDIDDVSGAGRACRSGQAIVCDEATFAASCDDSVVLYCDGSVVESTDCAGRGAGCSDGLCTGTGAPCTVSPSDPSAGVSCNGNVLESCQNGQRALLDCTTHGAGFGCRSVGEVSFCGLAADCVPGELTLGEAPQNGSPAPACDGTTLVFCNSGRLEHVDCTSLGFSGCDVNAALGCVPTPFTEL